MSKRIKPLLRVDRYQAACGLCRHGKPSPDGSSVLCSLRGVMRRQSVCKKYQYDPLKREPERAPLLPEFDPGEFAL